MARIDDLKKERSVLEQNASIEQGLSERARIWQKTRKVHLENAQKITEQILDLDAKILKLEEKKTKELKKQQIEQQAHLKNQQSINKMRETYTKMAAGEVDKQKDLSKGLLERMGNAVRLLGVRKLIGTSIKTELSSTVALHKKSGEMAATFNADINLQASGKKQLIDLTKGMVDGSYDLADVQNTILSLDEESQRGMLDINGNILPSILAQYDKLGFAKYKETEITKEIAAAEASAAKQKALSNKLNVAAAATFAVLLKLGKSFADIIDSVGKSFGSLTMMGEPFKNQMMDATIEAKKLGGGMEDVASITNTLASNFGVNVDEAAKLSDNIFDSSIAMGLSADEGANLFGVLMQTADLSFDQAEYLAESTAQLARQAGVAPTAVMKDLASSTEAIAKFTKDGGDNIAEAAIQARQMGLTLDTSAKIADSLLDFQSSISGEIEASVMIGKQLNFQKARELALSGDIAGATKDIVSQLGSEAEFNKLNVLQREALAKSIGVSTAELAKMVGQTDKLTLSGALAAGSFDDLAGQEALSNLSSITNEVKALFTEALIKIGPEIERIVGNFRDWLGESDGVAKLGAFLTGAVDSLEKMIKYLPMVVGLLVTLKTVSLAAAAAQAILAVAKATSATALIGGIGGLAVAAMMGMAVTNALSFMKVDDFKAGPGGIDFISGPAGAFNVNPRDTIVGTTNRVNDFESGPPGSISDDKSDANHKETISILTQGFKNLTAATLAPMPLRFAMMNGEILARTADKIGGKLSPYG